MGKTLTEKILARASGCDVFPGDIVNVQVDKLMVVDISGPIVFGLFEKMGLEKVEIPDKITLMTDHYGAGHSIQTSNMIVKFREYARKYEIKNFYEHGRNGICHQVMAEEGFLLPGTVVLGTDSHATTYGAYGAFGCGVSSTEAAVIMATGKVWLRVPSTLRVVLNGQLPFGCYGKDVALRIIQELGCDVKAIYKAVEIIGEGLLSLNMDDRLAICNMLAESGAKNCIIPADSITQDYLSEVTNTEYQMLKSDDDAHFDETIEINLNELVPLIATPHLVSNIYPVNEVEGQKITQAFFGSCTSGRLSEIAVAAEILEGRILPPYIVLRVVPASQKIYLEAIQKGYIETLMKAGAVVESSSCAACAGMHTGVLGTDEICISTTNRNFAGRMGSSEASIFLASAATAVASALEGKVTDPRKYLKKGDE